MIKKKKKKKKKKDNLQNVRCYHNVPSADYNLPKFEFGVVLYDSLFCIIVLICKE